MTKYLCRFKRINGAGSKRVRVSSKSPHKAAIKALELAGADYAMIAMEIDNAD